MDYYDFVLVAIPVTMIGLTGALAVAGLPFEVALAVASALAAAVVGHALFVRAPVARHDDRAGTEQHLS